MYPFFPYNPELTRHGDLVREQTRRPATHLEVIQRNREIDRRHWLTINEREEEFHARGRRVPTRLESIRRAISRVLIHTGERIDPQAA